MSKRKLHLVERNLYVNPPAWDRQANASRHPDRLYFAYGSNLNVDQMRMRCPDSRPVTACKLPGWSLEFARVLTIEKDKPMSCYGALYLVSEADELSLDRFEGWPRVYRKQRTHVTLKGGRLPVFFYVKNGVRDLEPPAPAYYAKVKQGYKDWHLPVEHLRDSRIRALRELTWFNELDVLCEMQG